jgi:hypothetical protein
VVGAVGTKHPFIAAIVALAHMNKAKISENPFISQVHIAAASLGLALVKSVAEQLGV